MLFRMLDIVLEQLAKIHKGFPRSEFGRERIVERWQDLLLDLAHGNGVIRLFACQFLDRKICWEFHDRQARFARLLSDQLLTKFRQKIIRREVQPEFFASLQIFAGLRRDLANQLAIQRTLEIKHSKIAHLQSTSWHIDKIS